MSRPAAAGVITRIREALGLKSDGAVARHYGLARSTVGNWRTRGVVPYDVCERVAAEAGVCLEWLLTGQGPKLKAERDEAVLTLTEQSGLTFAERLAALRAARDTALVAGVPETDGMILETLYALNVGKPAEAVGIADNQQDYNDREVLAHLFSRLSREQRAEVLAILHEKVRLNDLERRVLELGALANGNGAEKKPKNGG